MRNLVGCLNIAWNFNDKQTRNEGNLTTVSLTHSSVFRRKKITIKYIEQRSGDSNVIHYYHYQYHSVSLWRMLRTVRLTYPLNRTLRSTKTWYAACCQLHGQSVQLIVLLAWLQLAGIAVVRLVLVLVRQAFILCCCFGVVVNVLRRRFVQLRLRRLLMLVWTLKQNRKSILRNQHCNTVRQKKKKSIPRNHNKKRLRQTGNGNPVSCYFLRRLHTLHSTYSYLS